jgi:prophage antirepressor-like protein
MAQKAKINYFDDKEIKTLDISGKIWLNCSDVGKILGFKNDRAYFLKTIRMSDFDKIETLTRGGRQQINYLTLNGVKSIIKNRSPRKKDEVERFENWIDNTFLTDKKESVSAVDLIQSGHAKESDVDSCDDDCFTEDSKTINHDTKQDDIKLDDQESQDQDQDQEQNIAQIVLLHQELKKSGFFEEKKLIAVTLDLIQQKTGLNTDSYLSLLNNNGSKKQPQIKQNKAADIDDSKDYLSVVDLSNLMGLSSAFDVYKKLESLGLIKKTIKGYDLTDKGKKYGKDLLNTGHTSPFLYNDVQVHNFVFDKSITDLF